MRIIVPAFVLSLLASAPAAFALPQLVVTVADSGGKPAFKGATSASGTFETGTLKPGPYVVQFNAKTNVTAGDYALVISAGKKKVTAGSIPAAKFSGGGVAMRIDVGSGLNITGQVMNGLDTKVDKNGKKMVWIPKQLGSNLPAHWAEADSAEAKSASVAGSISNKTIMDQQAHQDGGH